MGFEQIDRFRRKYEVKFEEKKCDHSSPHLSARERMAASNGMASNHLTIYFMSRNEFLSSEKCY